jgi:hypothetical protein
MENLKMQNSMKYYNNTIKPVYKGHSREPENGVFEQLFIIYRLKSYALYINGKNETVLL